MSEQSRPEGYAVYVDLFSGEECVDPMVGKVKKFERWLTEAGYHHVGEQAAERCFTCGNLKYGTKCRHIGGFDRGASSDVQPDFVCSCFKRKELSKKKVAQHRRKLLTQAGE